MFGEKSRKLSAVLNFFNVVPVAYALSIGLFIQAFFGGPLAVTTTIGVAIVISYSMFGGLRSVVFSDVAQFAVMCLSVLMVVLFSWTSFGGLSFLSTHLPSSHFDPMGGTSLANTLVWGLIAFSTLVDPSFYQRCFAAQSTKVARNGILISTFIWFCFDICTTLGGMYARAILPTADSQSAYLIYAVQLLPDGLRGLFLAGIAATILSTLDSFLFIASNTVAYDLLPARNRYHRVTYYLSFVAVGALAVFLSTFFEGTVRLVWKTLGTYFTACLLVPVLYGYAFPKKLRDGQFVFGSILGLLATSYWKWCDHSGFWAEIDSIYIGIAATSLGLFFYPFLNRESKPPSSRSE